MTITNISFLIFSYGIYYLLSAFCPSYKTIKVYKYNKKLLSGKNENKLVLFFSSILRKIIPSDYFIIKKINNMLSFLSLSESPYYFLSSLITPPLLCLVPFIILSFISPVFIIIYFLIILVSLYKLVKISKEYTNKKEALENECFILTRHICKYLKNTNDVFHILSEFSSVYKGILSDEIKKILAKSKVTSIPYVLSNYMQDSKILNDVFLGLICTYSGEDMTSYFSSLNDKFSDIAKNRKEKKIDKVRPIIKVITILSLIIFVLTYFVIMYSLISSSLSLLFM